ncbi:hypothetical protein [Parapedobacter tibetensis]|uniref:hypothetical protein n=1 Tax=Parapedobacter tibetensis TaxID=2972951 RepID=UPI00214D53B6|nr:hypothetical protein [Parapedobacter tibetensis]
MKCLKQLSIFPFYLLLIGFVLFSGCKRDAPLPKVDGMRSVAFRISGFETSVSPLSGREVGSEKIAWKGADLMALKNIEPDLEPQFLYYWSFNDETLAPDIAVDEVGAGISFEAAAEQPLYYAGFAFGPFAAGQAMSLRGASSMEVSLPLTGVPALESFAFDISSSDTGPKDFLLSYSTDGGTTYEALSATNQFENMGSQSRNTYSVDLSGFSEMVGAAVLKLKFEFLAGNRDEASDYNPTQGTVRFDNIRLSGVYNAEGGGGNHSAPSTLQYYVFSQEDGSMVQQRQMPMSELQDGLLEVRLENGIYDVLFVAYRSDKGVLLPQNLTNASQLYLGQHFDDPEAVIYSLLMESIEVDDQDTQESAVLKRCYSLVEFNFTDHPSDLLTVKEIVLKRLHEDFFYTPFGIPENIPMSNAQSITFGNVSALIEFNQFLGQLTDLEQVSYELIAYGEDGEVLNTVAVSHQIPNNVRLVFTGRLLGDIGRINGFDIAIGTDWDDTVEGSF